MKILVTGHAGFIGSNLVKRLFKEMQTGRIVGIDNLNDYYDPSLKEYRLAQLAEAVPAGIEYRSVRGDISDRATVEKLFAEYQFDVVVTVFSFLISTFFLDYYVNIRRNIIKKRVHSR